MVRKAKARVARPAITEVDFFKKSSGGIDGEQKEKQSHCSIDLELEIQFKMQQKAHIQRGWGTLRS